MERFWYTLLIALTNNVDNIGARIAYSLGGIHLSTPVNLWITLITFVISFLAARSGTLLIGSVGAHGASLLAMGCLVALGAWMILEPYVPKRESETPSAGTVKRIFAIVRKPEQADLDNSKHIDFTEATVLGIALSLNNLGGSVSAGLLGLNAFHIGVWSAVFNFVTLWAGNYLAEFFIERQLTDNAAVVGGVALIAIGLGQMR